MYFRIYFTIISDTSVCFCVKNFTKATFFSQKGLQSEKKCDILCNSRVDFMVWSGFSVKTRS